MPSLPGGSALGRIDDGWLRLTASADRSTLDEWGLLQLNSRLPLAARCALDPRTGRPIVCADVSLQHSVPITTRIGEACDGLVMAKEVLTVRDIASPVEGIGIDHGGIASPGTDGGAADQLLAACGWPVSEGQGGLVVQIGVSSSMTAPAIVRPYADGAFCLDTTLPVQADSDIGRGAVARCLLAITGAVRGVRASVRHTSGTVAVGLESGFDSAPCKAEVQSGLSALSVAWDRCTREVRALQDPRVAETYLALFELPACDSDVLSAVG